MVYRTDGLVMSESVFGLLLTSRTCIHDDYEEHLWWYYLGYEEDAYQSFQNVVVKFVYLSVQAFDGVRKVRDISRLCLSCLSCFFAIRCTAGVPLGVGLNGHDEAVSQPCL